MVRRRKMVMGMGLLATGSGAAFTSAAFSQQTNPGANMELYAEKNLAVSRGAADFNSSYTISDKSDLPAAYIDESGGINGALVVNTANRIQGSHTFTHLLEVANNGDTTENVGFGYSTFSNLVDSSNTSGTSDGDVERSTVQALYSFEVNDAASPNDFTAADGNKISPASGNSKDAPANWVELSPGETLAVDLTVDASGNIPDLRDAISSPSGNPFSSPKPVAGATLVEEISVGIQ